MKKEQERNRKIPDPIIGFHTTGIYGLGKKDVEFLESILKPVEDYFDSSKSKFPPHISCRYFGYSDEVSSKQVKEVIPVLKEIYDKFLPIEFVFGNLYNSWESSPDYDRKLLMIKAESPKLKLLHEEILRNTKEFPIFSKVESENYNPHFTLGVLRKEYTDKIPEQVIEFADKIKIKPYKASLSKAYIYIKESGFQDINSLL